MFSDVYAAFVVGQLSLASARMVPVVVVFAAFVIGGILCDRRIPGPDQKGGGFGLLEPLFFMIGMGFIFILNSLPTTFLGRIVLEYQLFFRWMGMLPAILLGRRMLGSALTDKPRRGGASFGTMFLIMGMGLAAGWHPNTGVLLNSIVVFAASAGNQGAGLWLLIAFTLGMMFPFILIGLLLFGIARRVPAGPLGIRATLGLCGFTLLVFGGLLALNRLSCLIPGDWALYSY